MRGNPLGFFPQKNYTTYTFFLPLVLTKTYITIDSIGHFIADFYRRNDARDDQGHPVRIGRRFPGYRGVGVTWTRR